MTEEAFDGSLWDGTTQLELHTNASHTVIFINFQSLTAPLNGYNTEPTAGKVILCILKLECFHVESAAKWEAFRFKRMENYSRITKVSHPLECVNFNMWE